jgi:hypothetical protein
MTTVPEAGASSSEPSGTRKAALTVVSVLVLGTTITWAFFSMRAVMNVGGSCADGGPYVSSQSCPDGSWLIAVAVPVMLVTAIFGSMAALSVKAPNLLLPMWALLFGALGWNFLEYAVKGPGVVVGWLVCGVMFWLMAAPAVFAILVAIKQAMFPPNAAPPDAGSRWWVPAYAALGALGFLIGGYTYNLLD